jgi:LmbE family N-acetylglucosaminyl deacetylase
MITFDEMALKGEKFMAIAAHPDDIDFGCCATLALLSQMGKDVFYLICTNGDKGGNDPSVSSYDLIRTREKEQMAAAKHVGVKEIIFLRIRDGEIENNICLRGKLVENIRRYKPDILFTPDPANRTFRNIYINHRDHRVVGEAVFDAIYPAVGNIHFFPEQILNGLEVHEIVGICFFATHAPDLYVDIGSVIDIKIRALMEHKSQLSHLDELEQWVKKRFKHYGEAAGFPYAEAFRWLSVKEPVDF